MNPENDPPATAALNLPVFEVPQQPHLLPGMTWNEVTDHTEPRRQFYMKHFDSPEKRLRDKNPKPFRLH